MASSLECAPHLTARPLKARLVRAAIRLMVMAVMLNARVYEPRQKRNGRHPFHQDVFARRRDPSHAGGDRGAQGAAPMRDSPGWWRRPSRRWSRCIRRSTRSFRWPGGAGASRFYAPATLARDRRQPARHPGAALRRDRGQPGPAALGHDRPARARPAPRLRRAPASASRWRRRFTTSAIASAATCMRSSATACSAAWRLAMRRRARPITGSTARASPRRASAMPCCCTPPRGREKQWPEANWIALGQALGRGGARTRAAVGHRGRARAQRSVSPPRCRARAFPTACAARRGRAADRRRANSWSGSIPGCCILPPRSACRWWRSLPAASPDLTGPVGYGPDRRARRARRAAVGRRSR